MRYYTPLRYPGGKASLGQYMRQIFIDNKLTDGVYVEPYAGGAAIALELLMTGYAREVWLNDIDPAVHAFWFAALNHSDELIEKVRTVRLSVNEWRRQRAIYADSTKHDKLALGFAALYLNRTNRSGILNAGVIGGFKQRGTWGIDARFNREGLIDRLLRLRQYRHRIRLFNCDAEDFMQSLELPRRSLVYIDPPYFHKGQRLYRNHYEPADHARIAAFVQVRLSQKSKWIVSYDDTPEVSRLYKERRQLRYTLHYRAQASRRGGELMVFSDDVKIPGTANPAKFRIN